LADVPSAGGVVSGRWDERTSGWTAWDLLILGVCALDFGAGNYDYRLLIRNPAL